METVSEIPCGGFLSFQLEPEIKILMEQHQDLELVAESLIQNFQATLNEDHELQFYKDPLNELCRFFLISGQYRVLIRLCLRHIANPKFPFPWKYFVEALFQGASRFDNAVVELIKAGVSAEKAQEEIAFSNGAHHFIPDPTGHKKDLTQRRQQNLRELRLRLRDEVFTLRTQQLYDQEKALLLRLLKIFPDDKEITAELKSHRERRALDVLSRYSPLGRSTRHLEPEMGADLRQASAGLKESFQSNLASAPTLAFDFAMAAYMMDDFEACAEILDQTELNIEQHWFHLEVKLKCRRFLEVLQEVNKLEIALAADPETFFATAYIRAQAYWGLDQKHIAIEILESILAVRPQYRAGATLLDIWRTQ